MRQNKKIVSLWVKNLSEHYANVYPVFYEDFTNGGADVKAWESSALCNFLGVDNLKFTTDQIKVNSKNLKDIVINWEELETIKDRYL